MAPSLPLYKSNPEIFKTYVLSFSSDAITVVKGLTQEDEILALEIQLTVLINFFAKTVSELNNCSKDVILTVIKRQIRNYISPSNISMLSKSLILSKRHLPLFKNNAKLFERYVVQLISTPYNRGKGKIKGVTLKDRVLRIRVVQQAFAQEYVKVSAQLTNRSPGSIRADLDRKVESILQAYNHLLSFGSNN